MPSESSTQRHEVFVFAHLHVEAANSIQDFNYQRCLFREVVADPGFKRTFIFFPLLHEQGNKIRLSHMLVLAISQCLLYIW